MGSLAFSDPAWFCQCVLVTPVAPWQVQLLLDVADAPVEVYARYDADPHRRRGLCVPAGRGFRS